MSAIYIINGKPHRECDCPFNSNGCPLGNARTMLTAGFNRCMLPAENVIVAGAAPRQNAAPSPGNEELGSLIAELDALEAKATKGPFYLGDDDADDCPPHKRSGLALIDTGRQGDFDIARLMEWNNATFIAKLLNAWPKLRNALKGGEK
jgi:hypothetical protein